MRYAIAVLGQIPDPRFQPKPTNEHQQFRLIISGDWLLSAPRGVDGRGVVDCKLEFCKIACAA